MKRTYLIQRLKKSQAEKFKKRGLMGNPFGGGIDLNREAYNALAQFISFDYMGSAEFEFGALPEAISSIFKYAQRGEYTHGVITHNGKKNSRKYLQLALQ